MTLLQYYCKNCDKGFEELVKKYDDEVLCPVCGKPAERCYDGKMFSGTGTTVKKCSGNCKTCGGCK